MVKAKKIVARRGRLPDFPATVSVSQFSPLALPSDETDISDSTRTNFVSSTPVAKPPSVKTSGTNIAPSRPKPNRPDTLSMLREAINAIDEKKGASVQAIKKWIYGKYDVDKTRFRHYLKVAIEKGIANGVIVRPKSSQSSGAVGRLLIKKNEKPEKLKSDETKKKVKDNVKLARLSKSRERIRKRLSLSQTKKPKLVAKKTAVIARKISGPVKEKKAKDDTASAITAKPRVLLSKLDSKNKRTVAVPASKRRSIVHVKKTKVAKPKKP